MGSFYNPIQQFSVRVKCFPSTSGPGYLEWTLSAHFKRKTCYISNSCAYFGLRRQKSWRLFIKLIGNKFKNPFGFVFCSHMSKQVVTQLLYMDLFFYIKVISHLTLLSSKHCIIELKIKEKFLLVSLTDGITQPMVRGAPLKPSVHTQTHTPDIKHLLFC